LHQRHDHLPATTGVETSEQRQALAQLRRDYDAGEYATVARTVGLSVTLQTAAPAINKEALKLQAFSYCLLKDTQRCRRSFDRLLQIYPDFELEPAESQHPMWGPIFQQAQAHE
jgi:hypothetical protein